MHHQELNGKFIRSHFQNILGKTNYSSLFGPNLNTISQLKFDLFMYFLPAVKVMETLVKPPTNPAPEVKKVMQGIVEFLTLGETFQISAYSEDEKITIFEFMTVVVNNKIIDFITGDMQMIGKTAKPVTSVNVGDFVLVVDKSEG